MNNIKKLCKLIIINVNILFKIDIYFSECSLVAEINKKGVDRDIIFEIIRQKSLEKKLSCKFILNYDYELGNIHTFIDEFKNNIMKELGDKNDKLMINSEKMTDNSVHNFINIIKMPNIINNSKRHLEFLTPEEQLCEVNLLIKFFNKDTLSCVNINKKFSLLKQLYIIKNELLNKHKFLS